jgi:uncharacterized protein (TIGR02246 family)
MVFVLLFSSVGLMTIGQSADDEAAIRKLVKQAYTNFNNHDIEAQFALADENFENFNAKLKGREANQKFWAEVFKTRFKNVKYKQIEEIGIQFITPNVAIYKDRYEFSGVLDKEGNSRPKSTWNNAYVLVKKDGKWKYATVIQWSPDR